jgi:hypothetical protein
MHPAINRRCRIHHHKSYQIGGRDLAGHQATAVGTVAGGDDGSGVSGGYDYGG